jgi:hypothetical protein
MNRVSDAMVGHACAAYEKKCYPAWAYEPGMRAALEAVEAELCAREPGPFVLTEEEERAMEISAAADDSRYGERVRDALRRALRTLGPQPGQGGEDRVQVLETELRLAREDSDDQQTHVMHWNKRAGAAEALVRELTLTIEKAGRRIRELESAKQVAQGARVRVPDGREGKLLWIIPSGQEAAVALDGVAGTFHIHPHQLTAASPEQPAQHAEHGLCVDTGVAKGLEEQLEAAEEALEAEHEKCEELAGIVHQLEARMRELESARPVAQGLTAEDEAFVAGIEDMRPSVRAGKGNLLLAIIRKYHPRLRQGGGKPIREQLTDPLEAAGTTVHFVTQLARGVEWEPADYQAAHAAIREHAGFTVACDALDAVAYRLSAKPVAQELTAEEFEPLDTRLMTKRLQRLAEHATDLGEELKILSTRFPKPAPSEPADPVRELLAEMREDQRTRSEASLGHYADRLEAVLAARNAQKAGE